MKAVFFPACIVKIWNSLLNSVVDACTVNAFKTRLHKFWQHKAVKFDFTANLTGTGRQKPIRRSQKATMFVNDS